MFTKGATHESIAPPTQSIQKKSPERPRNVPSSRSRQ